MKRLIALTLIVLLASFGIALAKDGKSYGKDLTLEKQTKIADILENPEDFVGKKVLVNGLVTGVCAHRGCWLELAGDKDYETIRVKVTDGEIVFPVESKGKTALVEGEVYKMVFDKDGNLLSKTSDPHVCANHNEHADHKGEEKSKKKEDSKKLVKADDAKKVECAHAAEGKEEAKTEAKAVAAEEETTVIYQIRGIGAVLN